MKKLEQSKIVVNESAAVVLDAPEKGAHVEDVLRYGTPVSVLEEKGDWARISYEGWPGDDPRWIRKEQLLHAERVVSHAMAAFRGAYVFHVPDTEWGPIFYLPFESSVEVIQELSQRWAEVKLQDGKTGFVQRSQLQFNPSLLSLAEMIAFSKNFLGLNYIYGGTTSLGYDCSGFVQMLYRQTGISLPRNASMQAADPRFSEVEEARAGDLVFFFNGSGKVVHVALMINSEEFIHSFTKREAWVCIGKLAEEKWRNGHIYSGVQVKRITPFCGRI